MDIMHIAAKVAFTMVALSWFFVSMCKLWDYEPPEIVKAVTILIFVFGLVTGVSAAILWVWLL